MRWETRKCTVISWRRANTAKKIWNQHDKGFPHVFPIWATNSGSAWTNLPKVCKNFNVPTHMYCWCYTILYLSQNTTNFFPGKWCPKFKFWAVRKTLRTSGGSSSWSSEWWLGHPDPSNQLPKYLMGTQSLASGRALVIRCYASAFGGEIAMRIDCYSRYTPTVPPFANYSLVKSLLSTLTCAPCLVVKFVEITNIKWHNITTPAALRNAHCFQVAVTSSCCCCAMSTLRRQSPSSAKSSDMLLWPGTASPQANCWDDTMADWFPSPDVRCIVGYYWICYIFTCLFPRYASAHVTNDCYYGGSRAGKHNGCFKNESGNHPPTRILNKITPPWGAVLDGVPDNGVYHGIPQMAVSLDKSFSKSMDFEMCR